MSPVDPLRVELWDAINEYAAACGGRPDQVRGGLAEEWRMSAVVWVERVVQRIKADVIMRRLRYLPKESKMLTSREGSLLAEARRLCAERRQAYQAYLGRPEDDLPIG